MREEDILILAAFVEISSYRKRTMEAIGHDAKIPTRIAEDCSIRPNHISHVLGELKEKHLVECINEEMRKGRLYRLTGLGEKVLESIQ